MTLGRPVGTPSRAAQWGSFPQTLAGWDAPALRRDSNPCGAASTICSELCTCSGRSDVPTYRPTGPSSRSLRRRRGGDLTDLADGHGLATVRARELQRFAFRGVEAGILVRVDCYVEAKRQ